MMTTFFVPFHPLPVLSCPPANVILEIRCTQPTPSGEEYPQTRNLFHSILKIRVVGLNPWLGGSSPQSSQTLQPPPVPFPKRTFTVQPVSNAEIAA